MTQTKQSGNSSWLGQTSQCVANVVGGDVEEWGNLLPFNITFRLNQEVILLRRGKFSLLEYRYGGGGGGPPISLGLVLTAAWESGNALNGEEDQNLCRYCEEIYEQRSDTVWISLLWFADILEWIFSPALWSLSGRNRCVCVCVLCFPTFCTVFFTNPDRSCKNWKGGL